MLSIADVRLLGHNFLIINHPFSTRFHTEATLVLRMDLPVRIPGSLPEHSVQPLPPLLSTCGQSISSKMLCRLCHRAVTATTRRLSLNCSHSGGLWLGGCLRPGTSCGRLRAGRVCIQQDAERMWSNIGSASARRQTARNRCHGGTVQGLW